MYTWRSTRTTKDFRELDNTRELTSYAIQSQYSASEKILAVCAGFQKRIDPHFDVDLFYKKMFDIYTAQGVGLDNWGVILQMPRTIPGPFLGPCFGFDPSGCHPFYHPDGSEMTYPPCGYDHADDDCPEVVCFQSGPTTHPGGNTGAPPMPGNIPQTNPFAVFTADTWPTKITAVATAGFNYLPGWLFTVVYKCDASGNNAVPIADGGLTRIGGSASAGQILYEFATTPFDPTLPGIMVTISASAPFDNLPGLDIFGCVPPPPAPDPNAPIIHNYPFVPDSSAADPDAFLITLDDEHYRLVLLYKALANISASDAATQNKLLSILIDSGVGDMPNTGYVLQVDTMVIRWVFEDFLDSIQLAIFKAVGTLARGAGVGWELYAINPRMVFGFDGSGMQPFNQAVFVPDYAMITPSLS
jgi:hypothetical protein